tara:strand:- start:1428 stop:2561 length:1134 start_codon:yes stop_codon:yes gene_type:complete
MAITVDRQTLSNALKAALSIAKNQKVIEILTYSLFDIQSDELLIYGCDGLTQVVSRVPLPEGQEPRRLLVPLRVCSETVALHTLDEIDINPTAKNHLTVRSDKSRQTLHCAANVDAYSIFEIADGGTTLEVDCELFLDALAAISHIAAEAEIRENLQSVGFEVHGDRLYLFATDSYRAAATGIPADVVNAGEPFLLASRSLTALQTTLRGATGTLSIETDDAGVGFFAGSAQLICRIPDYAYPFSNLTEMLSIPKNNHTARFARDRLMAAFSRVNVVTDHTKPGVDMTLGDDALVLEKEAASGTFYEETGGQADGGLSMVAPVKRILDAIENCPSDDYVVLRYSEGRKPIFVVPDGETAFNYTAAVIPFAAPSQPDE